MSSVVQVYMKKEARIRLKALAYIDNRTLAGYIEELSKKAVKGVSPERYRQAVEAVTAGPGE